MATPNNTVDAIAQGNPANRVNDPPRMARRSVDVSTPPAIVIAAPAMLTVAPTALPASHPLARLGPDEMGVVYSSDIYGRITAICSEQSAGPTAAAMLRDVLEIYR